jgi:Helix-turn-helix domain
MPWKECTVVDKRLRFVAQLLDGEAMSEVCRAFGISRKTGYREKIVPSAIIILQSMILSARSTTERGILTPSFSAVCRLITNSNLIGCSTGMSSGFVPFRILST